MSEPAPVVVEQIVADAGPAAERLAAGDGATLSLLLVGEHRGVVGPCGCESSPRGGFARFATLAAERRRIEPGVPLLLVHAGGWLSSAGEGTELSPATLEDNAEVHRALGQLRFDALATTWRDLPGVAAGPHPGMVSATHRTQGLPVLRERPLEAGGVRVVVTAVSGEGPPWLVPDGTTVLDPVEALRTVRREEEDLFVVLAYELAGRVDELAAEPGVDVVIDAARWNGIFAPRVSGGAVIVRTRDEGLSADELRLWVEDGRVTRAVDRVVPLGSEIAEDARVARYGRR